VQATRASLRLSRFDHPSVRQCHDNRRDFTLRAAFEGVRRNADILDSLGRSTWIIRRTIRKADLSSVNERRSKVICLDRRYSSEPHRRRIVVVACGLKHNDVSRCWRRRSGMVPSNSPAGRNASWRIFSIPRFSFDRSLWRRCDAELARRVFEIWVYNFVRTTGRFPRCSLTCAAQQIVGRERRERVSHQDWSGEA